MLIKYQPTHDHLKVVPLIPVSDEHKKYRLERTQVSLLPGINEVTDKEWEIMKTHLSRELKRNEISVIEKGAAKGKSGTARNLKDMPLKDAINLISECINPDTLAKWHKEETREEARLVIIEKMKELKIEIPKFIPGYKDDDNDEGDGGDDDPKEKELDKMTVEELKAYAAEKDIVVSGNKAEILAAIKEAEAK